MTIIYLVLLDWSMGKNILTEEKNLAISQLFMQIPSSFLLLTFSSQI